MIKKPEKTEDKKEPTISSKTMKLKVTNLQAQSHRVSSCRRKHKRKYKKKK